MMNSKMMNVSACVITKNQAVRLSRCLKALNDSLPGLELVVVDTGSEDDSVSRAVSAGAKVSSFSWCDDFSAAKNTAIERASNDLVLVVDSDEYLNSASLSDLTETFKYAVKHPEEVGRISRLNCYEHEGQRKEYTEWVNRLFDRRFFHYEGRIHEQVTPLKRGGGSSGSPAAGGTCGDERGGTYGSGRGNTYRTYRTALSFYHDGYDLDREGQLEKAGRNAALLRLELISYPEDAYLYFQLGKTLYVLEDYEASAAAFEKSRQLSARFDLEYMEDLYETWAYALLKLSRSLKALKVLEDIASRQPSVTESSDFVFLYGLVLMNNGLFEDAFDTFVGAASLPPSHTRGTNSFMAWYNAGVIREVQGRFREAKEAYIRCGGYQPALEGLKRLPSDA